MKKYYLITVAIVLLDQLTKWLVVSKMELGESIPLIDNLLYFTSHRNTGAAWGILEGRMWFFYILTVAVIGFVVYYMQAYGKTSKLLAISLAIVLGGTIGNFIDRVFRKEVVDFIHTTLFNFPIFNVADMALTFGVALMIIYVILDERKKKV